MRTPAGLPVRRSRVAEGKHQGREHDPDTDLEHARNECPQNSLKGFDNCVNKYVAIESASPAASAEIQRFLHLIKYPFRKIVWVRLVQAPRILNYFPICFFALCHPSSFFHSLLFLRPHAGQRSPRWQSALVSM